MLDNYNNTLHQHFHSYIGRINKKKGILSSAKGNEAVQYDDLRHRGVSI